MMKKIPFYLIAVCSILLVNIATAQINMGGKPLSLSGNLRLAPMKNLPNYVSPELDMAVINAENADEAQKSGIRYIGKLVQAHQTLQNSGVWETLPNGDRVWRLKITAVNALAITLYYDEFYLPKGARLFVFSTDGQEIYGGFSEENNNAQRLFVTAMTHSDECIIEYFEPADVAGQGIIHVGQVAHAYRDVKTHGASSLAPLVSGACNVDVTCPEGANWVNERHATVTLLTTANASQAFCSGAIVNNLRQDCTPYMLTADHCITGTSAAGYQQMAFYFNHEHATCGGTIESTNQIVAGAVFCASSGGSTTQQSDFALLRITSPIPAAANMYFSGWDANDVASPSGVGIHHPAGDVKKISTYNTPLVSTDYSAPAPGVTHWYVQWVATQTNYGITEGGSSGSPLFNSSNRIVGDLSGGPSSCTATDKSDYYGKFSYSWTSCGTTLATQLKPWLDPDNTGVMAMDGTYAPCSGFLLATASATKSVCAGATDSVSITTTINGTATPVTLVVTGLPAGVTATLTPATLAATGNSLLTFAVGTSAATGTYNVTVTGTNATSTKIKVVALTITNAIPTTTILNTPLDAATNIINTPTLDWAAIAGASNYTVQLATDNAFANIVATGNSPLNNFTVSGALLSTTTYYWRVRAVNGCGTGAFSTPFSFTTNNTQCAIVTNSTITNLLDTATTTTTVAFGGGGAISSVRVLNLQGTHTYTGDLTFTLISPQGTRVVLLSNLCGTANDFDLSLDDASTLGAPACPLTGGFTYQPESPLSVFNGENPAGNWTMEVTDNGAMDTGVMKNWSLAICFTSSSAICVLSANVSAANICAGGAVTATAANGAASTSTYAWANGATTATISNLAVGIYTVTITNGACSATNSVSVAAVPTIAIAGNASSCGATTLTASGGTAYAWSGGNATVPPVLGAQRFTLNGTYTVTVTGASGCTVASSIIVVINTNPTLSTTGATTACGTLTLTITPITGATYAWSGGNAPASNVNSFATSGTYTATITSAAGCTRTGTRTVTVNQVPIGTATPTAQTATPANGSLQVAATGGAAPYTFAITGASNTTGTFAGLAAGNYIVTVTSAAPACSSTVLAVIDYNVATQNLPINIRSLQLSPNPTQGQFTLMLDLLNAENTSLDIIDMMGRKVVSQAIDGTNSPVFNLDLSAYPADLYFIQLHIGNEILMLKVSVVR